MAVPNYTFDESLARFNISKAAFIAAHPPIARVMAAAMVFRPNPSSSSSSPSSSSPPQTLLLCRAATDSYPLKWEIPGGSVDADDATNLQLWGKVTALVTTVRGEEEEVVVLRDEEHGEAAWVTEEDVQRGELPEGDGTKGRRAMDFVSDGVRRAILDGFRVYEKSMAKENNGA
ncbi:hypothetical protein MY5147_008394 [Beauveria neobassiana]